MTVDEQLLALLESMTFIVYDGYVEVDETDKVITAPLPHAVFYSSTGEDTSRRLSGHVGGRIIDFQIMSIGSTREQAKWAADKSRDTLDRTPLNGSRIIHQVGQVIRRDDDYTRPGGGPLFYGVDQYAVAT